MLMTSVNLWVVTALALFVMFLVWMTATTRRPAWDGPGRIRVWATQADGWLATQLGGHQPVLRYAWRYMDGDGIDITEAMHTGDVVAEIVEAVQVGDRAEGGPVLLRLRLHGSGVWRIDAAHGGLLGDQVNDAAMWVQGYPDPIAALHTVARSLRMNAVEC